MKPVAFTQPDFSMQEIENLRACLHGRDIAGDGAFTAKCKAILESHYGASVLLTHSCTAALEMAALLLVGPGDEVIMPSYTFVSTANAFVLRGAVPVFVDVRADTLNIDERLIEPAIGERTRAIVPVHYAGIGCDMETIMTVAEKRGIAVIEDAAQGYLARWNGRRLGTFGLLGAVSFHQTKNIVSGEGGLLVINDQSLTERATIIRDKGTNRTQFLRGEVDRYEWLDIGSSFLPSDLVAAVLLAQIQAAEPITARRLKLWAHYHEAFAHAECKGWLHRPVVPSPAAHNGHIYYVRFDNARCRDRVRTELRAAGIAASTHYVPLHSSPAGKIYGRVAGTMQVTDRVAGTMLRLPIYGGMNEADIERIVDLVVGSTRGATFGSPA